MKSIFPYKVDCKTCIYFIKTVTHHLVNSKNPELSLCSKIGFRIIDRKDPHIRCNFYVPDDNPKGGTYMKMSKNDAISTPSISTKKLSHAYSYDY